MQEFSERELGFAKTAIEDQQCLCTEGPAITRCENCDFRNSVKEQITKMEERQKGETIKIDEE